MAVLLAADVAVLGSYSVSDSSLMGQSVEDH